MSDIDFNRLNGPQSKILRETLLGVFGRRDLEVFLRDNDYGRLENLVESGRFDYQVFELIEDFARKGRLGEVMADVRREYPKAPALEDLTVRLGFTDAEADSQRVLGGRGLEKMVREAGFNDLFRWTGRLAAAGQRVCRITYPLGYSREVRGTGFLVGRDLVLTNYHVIEKLLNDQAEAGDVRLSFGYAETDDGPPVGDSYRLAQDWRVAHAPYSDADLKADGGLPKQGELDFALLRLDQLAGETLGPAGKRGWFDLARAPQPARDDAIVFVLQHPKGEPLKHSIGILQKSGTPLRLRYDADTRVGSSGGLVLDQRLAPVALHHVGEPGSKLKASYNQGIPLPLIHAALEASGGPPRVFRASGPSSGAAESAVESVEKSIEPRTPPMDSDDTASRGGPPLLFYSYAREDEDLRRQLALHIKLLERQKILRTWYDGNIEVGGESDAEIQRRLREADIILLLASPEYLGSDELWSREVEIALDRHDKRQARVIPIVLRSVVWDNTPFSHLQRLPRDRRPIADRSKPGRDQAFAEIAGAIREIAAKITKDRS